jgi:dimethylsulfoniopropionate demethylase
VTCCIGSKALPTVIVWMFWLTSLMSAHWLFRVRRLKTFWCVCLVNEFATFVSSASTGLTLKGYSKQGGFEIYVEGGDIGMPLWNALFAVGDDLNVRAGCPNLIERIEGGLLSYGNDMTDDNTPHECGLGRFCDTQTAIGCIGRDALLRVAKEGPVQQLQPIEIAGPPVPPCDRYWQLWANGKKVGKVTSAAWSPDFEVNVAIGMVRMTHWDPGTDLEVETPDGMRPALVREQFWI